MGDLQTPTSRVVTLLCLHLISEEMARGGGSDSERALAVLCLVTVPVPMGPSALPTQAVPPSSVRSALGPWSPPVALGLPPRDPGPQREDTGEGGDAQWVAFQPPRPGEDPAAG